MAVAAAATAEPAPSLAFSTEPLIALSIPEAGFSPAGFVETDLSPPGAAGADGAGGLPEPSQPAKKKAATAAERKKLRIGVPPPRKGLNGDGNPAGETLSTGSGKTKALYATQTKAQAAKPLSLNHFERNAILRGSHFQ